jgi:hypothetical protein
MVMVAAAVWPPPLEVVAAAVVELPVVAAGALVVGVVVSFEEQAAMTTAAKTPTATMRRDLIMNAYTGRLPARFTRIGEKLPAAMNRSPVPDVKDGVERGGHTVRRRLARPVGGTAHACAA